MNLHRIMGKGTFSSTILEYSHHSTGSEVTASPITAATLQGSHEFSSQTIPPTFPSTCPDMNHPSQQEKKLKFPGIT